MAGASSAYGASKGGVISPTRNIASQYVPSIRANSVCLGPVDTQMLVTARSKAGPTRRNKSKGPMLERWADPGEVAELALYLASDSSAFVTAANFVIDGGLSAI
ncbi:MAG: SDR family oxidoreductase [Chloroflexi bacterium]|nr:SDR family oxidoreductase [Chloroflexota bacterium]